MSLNHDSSRCSLATRPSQADFTFWSCSETPTEINSDIRCKNFILHVTRELIPEDVGNVYQARLEQKQTTVKIITKGTIMKKDELKQAATLQHIDHPNIVKLINVLQTNETEILLIFENYEDNNMKSALDSHVDRNLPFDVDLVKRWITQLASAIEYIHTFKISHHDIKPANILLNIHNDIKLGRIYGAKDNSLDDTDLLDSFPYMAPECFEERTIITGKDWFPVDVWAFGVVCFQLSTLKFPYIGDSGKMSKAMIKEFYQNNPKLVEVNVTWSVENLETILKEEIFHYNPAHRITAKRLEECYFQSESYTNILDIDPMYMMKKEDNTKSLAMESFRDYLIKKRHSNRSNSDVIGGILETFKETFRPWPEISMVNFGDKYYFEQLDIYPVSISAKIGIDVSSNVIRAIITSIVDVVIAIYMDGTTLVFRNLESDKTPAKQFYIKPPNGTLDILHAVCDIETKNIFYINANGAMDKYARGIFKFTFDSHKGRLLPSTLYLGENQLDQLSTYVIRGIDIDCSRRLLILCTGRDLAVLRINENEGPTILTILKSKEGILYKKIACYWKSNKRAVRIAVFQESGQNASIQMYRCTFYKGQLSPIRHLFEVANSYQGQTFGRITDMAFDNYGNLVVAEPLKMRLQIFCFDGELRSADRDTTWVTGVSGFQVTRVGCIGDSLIANGFPNRWWLYRFISNY